MATNTNPSRSDKIVSFLSLWVARLALTVLAVAGMMNLLGGVDHVIAYPVAVLFVAFLLKETL